MHANKRYIQYIHIYLLLLNFSLEQRDGFCVSNLREVALHHIGQASHQACHIHTYIHTYIHTLTIQDHIHAYIHTYSYAHTYIHRDASANLSRRRDTHSRSSVGRLRSAPVRTWRSSAHNLPERLKKRQLVMRTYIHTYILVAIQKYIHFICIYTYTRKLIFRI